MSVNNATIPVCRTLSPDLTLTHNPNRGRMYVMVQFSGGDRKGGMSDNVTQPAQAIVD